MKGMRLWIVAALSASLAAPVAAQDPEAGAAFLGSQGDIWDAQKDMLADGLGSIVAVLLFWAIRAREPRRERSVIPA